MKNKASKRSIVPSCRQCRSFDDVRVDSRPYRRCSMVEWSLCYTTRGGRGHAGPGSSFGVLPMPLEIRDPWCHVFSFHVKRSGSASGRVTRQRRWGSFCGFSGHGRKLMGCTRNS
jgi:hypothetical protein